MTKSNLDIFLAQPRGFCAGVERAVQIVEKALEKFGPPIYVRHEIVHNKYVVDDLKAKGVIFVENIKDIPKNSITIFSAHGVSEEIEKQANSNSDIILDATCPLVKKVHIQAQKYENTDHDIILIGHKGHPEVEGTSGRVSKKVILCEREEDVATLKIADPNKVSYVTQTTLSLDDTESIINKLKERFPNIKGPGLADICYATQNRQDAVKKICNKVELLLVIGCKNSSNSNRLKDIGVNNKIASYLIADKSEIDYNWFNNISTIGLTAGASAPEILVEEVILDLKNKYSVKLDFIGDKTENMTFKLPRILKN
jgi:4-hydroxy-3-methylbut-2-en-1-yl diphosphate reductase